MRPSSTCISLAITLLLLGVCPPSAFAQENEIQRYLRHRIEDVQGVGKLSAGGVRLTAVRLIVELYGRNKFKRVWTDKKKVDDLFRAIRDAPKDGLDPKDYHLKKLEQMRGRLELTDDPKLAVELDLLLTDALARFAYHAYYGKVDPERIDHTWNLEHKWTGGDGATSAQSFLASASLYATLEGLKPSHPAYKRYRQALARYRGYQTAGGWGKIPSGGIIEPGEKDPRLPAIRHRLAITGDLPKAQDNGSTVFDAKLKKAVQRFQKRHHIAVGNIGPQIIQAMNVSVKQRIDQIRVNLERARWILRDLDPTFVVVNIAAYEIYLIKDGKRVWENRAQVGRTFTQTPLFKEPIRYLVLNPTWTVPPGVLKHTVLPALKKNPRYIKDKDLRVLNRDGSPVDARKVKWSKYTAANFPFILRQDPGPDNALGTVKFMFPNKYHIYMHDTPNQLGYKARKRDMSWGCIHVHEPLELARLLIDDPARWDDKAVKAQVESGRSETIHLDKAVPVLLLYWTVGVPEGQPVQFYPDIYKRDRKVLRELKRGFKLRRQRRRGGPEPE